MSLSVVWLLHEQIPRISVLVHKYMNPSQVKSTQAFIQSVAQCLGSLSMRPVCFVEEAALIRVSVRVLTFK